MRGTLWSGRDAAGARSWARAVGRKAGARRSLERLDREGRRDMGLGEGHWVGQGGGIQECGSEWQ